MPMPKTAALLLLLPALLLGACGQTEPVVVKPPPVVAPVAATLSLRVFIPTAASSQTVRPQYVGAATSSLKVQLGSVVSTLDLNAATCTAVTGGKSCAFSLTVAPGLKQTLIVSAYDAADHLLSTSTQTVDILVGQDNPINLTLIGVAASVSFTAINRPDDITPGASGSMLLDRGGAYTAGIALLDAAGQVILNPGRPTETVTSSNPSFDVSSTVVGTFNMVAPNPTGKDQTTNITITGADGTLLLTQVLTVPAQRIVLSLSSGTPVAGSSILATARLTSARGQDLLITGRDVTFGATDGSFPGSIFTLSTDASGTASLSILTGTVSGTTGNVTAISDGVSASASYTSIVGEASTSTSTTVLSPTAAKVGGTSTLTVTLNDGNGNKITTFPTVNVSGNSTLGAATQNENVFTYAVTAAATPETASFSVISGGTPVGTSSLLVSAYALTVSDGGTSLTSGTSQYDFQNSSAHTFAVAETGHTGAFSVTSSNEAAATVGVNGGVLTVTPGSKAGFSTITVTDTFGQSFNFNVSVTTASLNVN